MEMSFRDITFQQHYGPKLTNKVAKSYFHKNYIVILECSAQSPDRKPLEHTGKQNSIEMTQ